MQMNSTSKIFNALGLSAVPEKKDCDQNEIHDREEAPRPKLSKQPSEDMKNALTHALGFSANKKHTPVD
jgi:hypothetical protein